MRSTKDRSLSRLSASKNSNSSASRVEAVLINCIKPVLIRSDESATMIFICDKDMKKSDATLVELKKVTIFAIPSKRDAGLVR